MDPIMEIAKVYEAIASDRQRNGSQISGNINLNIPGVLLPMDNRDKLSRGPEPAIIETLIIDAAFTFNVSLFGSTDGSDIAKWMEKISKQIEYVNGILIDVFKMLYSLDVLMDQKFFHDAEADILSRCATYIDNYPTISKDPSLEKNVALMESYLKGIQDATRKVMVYGYAEDFSVLFGLRCETDLLYLLKRNKDTKQTVFSRYKDHFKKSADPNVPGSVANRLPQLQNDLSPYESQYKAQDGQARFFDPPRYWIEKIYHERRDYLEKKKWKEHYIAHVSGSLDDGFRGDINRGQIFTDSSQPDSSYRDSRDEAFNEAQNQFNASLMGMNAAAFNYRIKKKERDCLLKSKKACEEFSKIADKLFSDALD
jgi:hypothetical protein